MVDIICWDQRVILSVYRVRDAEIGLQSPYNYYYVI
jgi:hypothetical protein